MHYPELNFVPRVFHLPTPRGSLLGEEMKNPGYEVELSFPTKRSSRCVSLWSDNGKSRGASFAWSLVLAVLQAGIFWRCISLWLAPSVIGLWSDWFTPFVGRWFTIVDWTPFGISVYHSICIFSLAGWKFGAFVSSHVLYLCCLGNGTIWSNKWVNIKANLLKSRLCLHKWLYFESYKWSSHRKHCHPVLHDPCFADTRQNLSSYTTVNDKSRQSC